MGFYFSCAPLSRLQLLPQLARESRPPSPFFYFQKPRALKQKKAKKEKRN
jgi:hypothetical protein